MIYADFLQELKKHAEPKLAIFHGGLIKEPPKRLLGIRTPIMRKIAKAVSVDEVLAFPDEYYEVTFIKLMAISYLPYESFISYLDHAIPLITNWALCDSFKPKCIAKHKADFLQYVERYFRMGTEFSVRFSLVMLLSYYVEREYLPLIFEYLRRADCAPYYVHMAAAWLTAEVLIKHFDDGVSFLREGSLDAKTHNKSIQKAVESYRLTNEQKEFLKTLKIKTI